MATTYVTLEIRFYFSVFRIILNHYVTTNTAGAYKCYYLSGTWNAFTSSCETRGISIPPFYKNIYSESFLKQQEIEQFKVHKEFDKIFESVHHQNGLDQVLYAEFQSKMVNDYLLTDDRMSMAHSVEERVPFLDRDLVDFGFTLPVEMKIKNNQTKNLFREAMKPYLPPRLSRKRNGDSQ